MTALLIPTVCTLPFQTTASAAGSARPGDTPWASFTRLQGLASDSIFALEASADGYLWVATNAGLSIRSPYGEWLTLTSADGLASDIITDIAPVPDNPTQRWIATDGGATLLDDRRRPHDPTSHQLISYGGDDNLVNTSIGAITVDHAGQVWLGTATLDDQGNEGGFGLSVLNPGAKLFDKTDDSWTSYTQANGGLSNNVVHDIVTDAEGTVWVATLSGLEAFREGQHTTYTSADGLPSNNVRALLVSGKLLWVATDQGLAVLDGGATPRSKTDDHWTIFNTGNSKLAANATRALAIDADGRIWIGTNWIDQNSRSDVGAGVSVLDPKDTPLDRADDSWVVFRAADGLASDAVRALLVTGDVYIGTRAGLSALSAGDDLANKQGDTWQTYLARNRLAGFTVNTLASAGAGMLWLGTSDGLSLLDYHKTPTWRGDDTWSTLTTVEKLPSNDVRTLASDARGWLWIGTNAGVQVRDLKGTPGDPKDDVWINYTTPTLKSDQINELVIDGAGRAWIACGSYFEGALHVLDPGSLLASAGDDQLGTFTTASGLPNTYVRGVALEGLTAVWVATDSGAGRLVYGASPFNASDDTWTSFKADNSGIGQNLVRDVFRDKAGNTWFALAVGGVSVYLAGGGWASFATGDGLISDATRTVIEDAKGQIWIGTSGGVSMLRGGSSLASKGDDEWAGYGADALTYESANALLVEDTGQLWVATFGGASLYGMFVRRYLPMVRH